MIYVGVLFRNNENLVAPYLLFLKGNFSDDTPYKIIAVDDNSNDRTNEFLKASLRKDDILIRNESNLGVAKCRNKIVLKAKELEGDWADVVLMDSDVFIILKDSIHQLKLGLRLAGVSFGKMGSFWDKNEECTTGMAFCMIKGEVFKKIGLFDERFFMFYDDTDFVHRFQDAGFKYQECSDARSVHMWGSTTRNISTVSNRKEIIGKDRALYELMHKVKMTGPYNE